MTVLILRSLKRIMEIPIVEASSNLLKGLEDFSNHFSLKHPRMKKSIMISIFHQKLQEVYDNLVDYDSLYIETLKLFNNFVNLFDTDGFECDPEFIRLEQEINAYRSSISYWKTRSCEI